MNSHCKRASTALALLLSAGLVLATGDIRIVGDHGFVSSAQAQPLRKLIARLRGQTQSYGIAKAQGRIEANQVDVSSKYAGQLADISVEEGSTVAIGQAIARISSPEIEAQLRAAQSDLQSAQGAFAAAEADIASRKAAFEFAKSDFERGRELMKTGFITKQLFEERQRNFEAAQAAVETMSARRDQAKASIAAAEAKVQQIDSMIQDLTLVSPRNGKVQYQLARKGETIAAGEPIVTILDLTDLRMIIFLPAVDAGRLGVGGEARVVLDAVPDYVIPAEVSFVASESQFTPKTVETKDERAKLMFRVELRIDRQVLKTYYGRVEGGLTGFGFVRTRPDAKWPAELEVKLPPAPASPPIAETPAPAAAAPTSTPVAQVAPPPAAVPAPASAPAPQANPPAAAPVAPAPAPVAQAAPRPSRTAPSGASRPRRPFFHLSRKRLRRPQLPPKLWRLSRACRTNGCARCGSYPSASSRTGRASRSARYGSCACSLAPCGGFRGGRGGAKLRARRARASARVRSPERCAVGWRLGFFCRRLRPAFPTARQSVGLSAAGGQICAGRDRRAAANPIALRHLSARNGDEARRGAQTERRLSGLDQLYVANRVHQAQIGY